MSGLNAVSQSLGILFPDFSGQFPEALKKATELLILQSNNYIPHLKPDEEVARSIVCALLAFEKVEAKIQGSMNGQSPNISRVPLPPSKFQNLRALFRNKLLGVPNESIASIPSQSRSPRKPTGRNASPKKQSSGVVLTVSPSKSANMQYSSILPTPQTNPDVDGYDDGDKSAPKRARRAVKPGVFKTGTRARDPTREQIIALCERLAVKKPVSLAILKGYRLYNELVKDKWGLLCGIIVVVIAKGQPNLIEKGIQAFYGTLKDLVSITDERLEEWIRWASSIINDQSWIRKVTDSSFKSSVIQKDAKKYSSGIGNMVSLITVVFGLYILNETNDLF